MRTYENGLLYPDSIASDRIMMMPPGVVAVLLMFSRNHNHIADNLLTVNESGKYKPWNELDAAGKQWYVAPKGTENVILIYALGKTKIFSN